MSNSDGERHCALSCVLNARANANWRTLQHRRRADVACAITRWQHCHGRHAEYVTSYQKFHSVNRCVDLFTWRTFLTFFISHGVRFRSAILIPNPNSFRSEPNNFSFNSLLNFRSPICTYNYPFISGFL